MVRSHFFFIVGIAILNISHSPFFVPGVAACLRRITAFLAAATSEVQFRRYVYSDFLSPFAYPFYAQSIRYLPFTYHLERVPLFGSQVFRKYAFTYNKCKFTPEFCGRTFSLSL